MMRGGICDFLTDLLSQRHSTETGLLMATVMALQGHAKSLYGYLTFDTFP